MANEEHLKILKSGVHKWNRWRWWNWILGRKQYSRPDLSNAKLMGANLYKANLRNCILQNVSLASANLQKANLSGADLSNAYMWGAYLDNANLQKAILKDSDLEQSSMNGADMSFASLNGANLNGALLKSAKFGNTSLKDVRLEGAILHYSIFTQSTIENSSFRLAELQNANLENVSIISTNFDKANLSSVDLCSAHLKDTDIFKANLADADISGMKISNIEQSGEVPKRPGKIFISYNNLDAHIARLVCESLMAAGGDVWFAEYKISLEEFNVYDVKVIEDKIKGAIKNANQGIVFIRPEYLKSPWCMLEYQFLKEKDASILFVHTHSSKDYLEGGEMVVDPINSFDFTGDFNKLFYKIFTYFGHSFIWKSKLIRSVKNSSPLLMDRYGIKASIHLGPLEQQMSSPFQSPIVIDPRQFQGMRFEAHGVIGSIKVALLLNFNPHAQNLPLLGSIKANIQITEPKEDLLVSGRPDFLVYRLFTRVADNAWYGAHNFEPYGLHLYQWPGRTDLSNQTNLGLTCINRDKQNEWHRFYHIGIQNRRGDEAGEITMSFAVEIDMPSREEAFEKFCKLTPFFDAIAGSLRYLQ